MVIGSAGRVHELATVVPVSAPVSDEIAATLGRFFTGGAGPRHTDLDAVFLRTGFGDIAPYDDTQPNKEIRVRRTVQAAIRRPTRARELVEGLLAEMRAAYCFEPRHDQFDVERFHAAQQAFGRAGWELTDDGELRFTGAVELETGGRPALDEQLARLQGAIDDPALAIGAAKDLLEAVAKFVLEEIAGGVPANADFSSLWFHARDRLGIHPKDVTDGQPGGSHVRAILQSTWTIAEKVNDLRNEQGTGHGRTLPTGITSEMAVLVVREACSVAEFTLRALDRAVGR